MAARILTWNLQGRARPPIGEVAAAIEGFGSHVAALQEVQRAQARALADRLGWQVWWTFKHWPLVIPAEGLALLTPEPLVERRRATLAAGARAWSSRRRVALAGLARTPAGPLAVVDTHLGAGVGVGERVRQARVTADLLGGAHGCVVGDLNTRPGSAVLGAFASAGLRDAWEEVHPGDPGPTNWGRGPRDGAPTKRLDYVLVTPSLQVLDAEVPRAGEPGFGRWGALSDHLPVVVTVENRAR